MLRAHNIHIAGVNKENGVSHSTNTYRLGIHCPKTQKSKRIYIRVSWLGGGREDSKNKKREKNTDFTLDERIQKAGLLFHLQLNNAYSFSVLPHFHPNSLHSCSYIFASPIFEFWSSIGQAGYTIF